MTSFLLRIIIMSFYWLWPPLFVMSGKLLFIWFSPYVICLSSLWLNSRFLSLCSYSAFWWLCVLVTFALYFSSLEITKVIGSACSQWYFSLISGNYAIFPPDVYSTPFSRLFTSHILITFILGHLTLFNR